MVSTNRSFAASPHRRGTLVSAAPIAQTAAASIGGLLAQGEPTAALAHLDIDAQGFAWLPRGDVMSVPAWKQVPTWFVVAQNDEAIPADAERFAIEQATSS